MFRTYRSILSSIYKLCVAGLVCEDCVLLCAPVHNLDGCGLHNRQQCSTGHSIVPLGLEQSFVEVGHKLFAAVLYLGQYSTNPQVAGVGVDQ